MRTSIRRRAIETASPSRWRYSQVRPRSEIDIQTLVQQTPPLQTADPVLLKLNNEKRWSQLSTVVRRDPINRSYIVQTDAGVVKPTPHRLHTPLASHFHFTSHSLNLVLAHSCKLNGIRNMIDKLTEACLFFN